MCDNDPPAGSPPVAFFIFWWAAILFHLSWLAITMLTGLSHPTLVWGSIGCEIVSLAVWGVIGKRCGYLI